jgi:hypothetical protein
MLSRERLRYPALPPLLGGSFAAPRAEKLRLLRIASGTPAGSQAPAALMVVRCPAAWPRSRKAAKVATPKAAAAVTSAGYSQLQGVELRQARETLAPRMRAT